MEGEPKLYRAIMVSSTFTDLEEHRREVIDAIHRFGFHANVMEYSGARSDADVIETSLRMVRESAAYLCVIGHKYGQTPADADRNPKGLSITELEFNAARRLGRPILLFLMADDHPVLPADVEPDVKKRKKLDAFRKQAKRIDPGAATERVYDTFASEAEFAKKAAIAVGLQAIRMAGGSDIPDRAIRDAIARFIDVKPDANQSELTDAIDRFETGYRALEQQLAAIRVTDNRVTSLKADAEAALAEGDLDKARAAYREAAEAARDKAAEPVRTAAELKSAEADAHLLALDWQAADAAWAEAEAMLAPFDRDAADELADDAAQRLSLHGELYGRAGALSSASHRWRQLARVARARRDQLRVAKFQNNLGNALATQGSRIGGLEGQRLLDEAILAFRDARTIYTRADLADQRAMTQVNLGDTLRIQGERTDGRGGLRLLDEAIAAFRDALTVYTRDDMRVQRATTQSNLGNALRIQGERTEGPEGLQLLAEAVACCRMALSVFTGADTPEAWENTQNIMGAALAVQGMRTPDPEGLRVLGKSVTAFRNALTLTSRADTPVRWAIAKNNLGNALRLQGERTGGAEGLRLLAEAVTAFRDAFTVPTRAEMPVLWARTQENLGLAYESMAQAEPGEARAHLVNAEAAFLDALTVYTPEHMNYDYGTAIRSLEDVRAKLATSDR
jgi:tetratricopeptide (TPR) repeat protein